MIAIVPDWFAPDGPAAPRDGARAAGHRARGDPRDRAAAARRHRARQPGVEPRTAAAVRRPAGQRAPGPVRAAAPDHVARQRRPASSTRRRASASTSRSLSPGSAFGVSSLPAAGRAQAPARPAVGPAAARSSAPSAAGVAARNGDEQWITGPVNGALGNLPLVRVEPTPGGPAYWGTGKLVEAVVVPGRPGRARAGAAAVRRRLGLPLVRRADRPLAVPAVRTSRPPSPPAHAASAGRPHVARRLHARGRRPSGRPAPRRGRSSGARRRSARRRASTVAGSSRRAPAGARRLARRQPQLAPTRRRPRASQRVQCSRSTVTSEAVSRLRRLARRCAPPMSTTPDLARVELARRPPGSARASAAAGARSSVGLSLLVASGGP